MFLRSPVLRKQASSGEFGIKALKITGMKRLEVFILTVPLYLY